MYKYRNIISLYIAICNQIKCCTNTKCTTGAIHGNANSRIVNANHAARQFIKKIRPSFDERNFYYSEYPLIASCGAISEAGKYIEIKKVM